MTKADSFLFSPAGLEYFYRKIKGFAKAVYGTKYAFIWLIFTFFLTKWTIIG
jgi:hypothetical protein